MELVPSSNRTSEPLLRYRNREIRESDLSFLRHILQQNKSHTRREVARIICEAWSWRQPSGSWSVGACVDLLCRLEEWGHVERTRRKVSAPKRRTLPELPLDLIPLAWIAPPPDSKLETLIVRPIEPEEALGWRIFMQRYHYLGFKMPIGEHIQYAACLDGEVVSLLAWCSAALRAPLREKFVGWNENTKRYRLHLVTNNVRFLIFPWVRIKNLASKILALNLRRLSADWQARWNHPVYLAETFVDIARFPGTCYRAANWRHLGLTAGRTKSANAYLKSGTPKAFYVYELHRHARRLLQGGGK